MAGPDRGLVLAGTGVGLGEGEGICPSARSPGVPRNKEPLFRLSISGLRPAFQLVEDLVVLLLYLVHARHDHLSRSLIGHVIHHPRHHVPRQPRESLAPLFGQIMASKDHPANDCCSNRHSLSCARLHVRFLLVPTIENLNKYQSQKRTAPPTLRRAAVSRDTRSFMCSAFRLAYPCRGKLRRYSYPEQMSRNRVKDRGLKAGSQDPKIARLGHS